MGTWELRSRIRGFIVIDGTSYLQQKKSSLCLETVNEVEVFLLLENLDGKKSFGVDKLHPYLASIAAFEIFRPVTYIINLSLKQCIYPDNLKIAKVIPIFKQGSRDSCDNYRPISVLPVLSKILEKCIYNQLMHYIITENIITPNQYGFMPGSTTVDCLVDLVEEISTTLDRGDYAVTIFLDLSKAFDTVNHSILLYSWRFSRYTAPTHWLVHGHMTSNNETVSRQTP